MTSNSRWRAVLLVTVIAFPGLVLWHLGQGSFSVDLQMRGGVDETLNPAPSPKLTADKVADVHKVTNAEAEATTSTAQGHSSSAEGLFQLATAEANQKQSDEGSSVATVKYHNPFKPIETTARPCMNGRYRQGAWVKNLSKFPAYPSYGEILGCCQRGYEAIHGKDAIRPETQYQWESSECDLIPWSEELFCKALRGRDIMLAGDSLNDHWHASLYYLLGGRKDIYKREGTIAGKHACHTHPICAKYYPKPLKLYFLTNQLLLSTSRRNRNHKWWKPINQYPILILNAGSWMRDPHDEEREVSDAEYQQHMRKALGLVREQGYNGTLIWRTTYQGHPFCWTYTEPLTEELKAIDFPTVAPYKRYRWAAIPGRNQFATKLWKDAGAHILDVTRITNLMPLGHLGRNHPKYVLKNTTDCLHYCSPGPIYDTWSMLLMNLLLGNLS